MIIFTKPFSRLKGTKGTCPLITQAARPSCIGIILFLISMTLVPVYAQAQCAPQSATMTELPNYACFSAAKASSVYSNPTKYQILRKGKKIGDHTITFTTSGASTIIEVASNIKVTVLKVPVFSFKYRSSESWEKDVLVKVEATTTENSTTTKVSAIRNANSFVLQQDGASQTVTGMEFSSNHWHPGVLGASSLFNTLTGKQNTVRIEQLGNTQLALPAGNIKATHFRYTGSLEAEVWYDDTGRWVQLRFENDDGSEILYQLDKS